jgi:tetratricopeptide (TPR) repeat protein
MAAQETRCETVPEKDMTIKNTFLALISALVLTAPTALAKEQGEPPAPGSGGAGANAKANLASDLYADGKRRYESKDFKVALERFNTVVELDPKCIGGFYYRGLTNRQLGKKEAAKVDFKKAAAMTASSAEEYDLRGKSKQECGQTGAAEADFSKARELSKKAG